MQAFLDQSTTRLKLGTYFVLYVHSVSQHIGLHVLFLLVSVTGSGAYISSGGTFAGLGNTPTL